MNNTKASIDARFARAIASVGFAPKDGSNPMFKSRYVTLDGVLSVVKPALAAQDLVLMQQASYIAADNLTRVTTKILDIEGNEKIDLGATDIPMVKLDAQSMGSATTYGRRYALTAIFSLEAEDDDGNAATHPPARVGRPEPKPIPGAVSAHEPEEDPFIAGTYESHRDAKPLTPARPLPIKPVQTEIGTNKAESKISGIIKKQGQGPKGPWTRWDLTFEDGTRANTFSEELAELALDANRKRTICAYDVRPANNPKWAADLIDLMPVIYADADDLNMEPATKGPF